MHVVVLVGSAEEIRVAVGTGVLRRAGVGADVKGFGIKNRFAHGQHHIGKHHAGHEIHFFLLHQPVGGLARRIGLGLVVGHDHLDRQSTELAAGMLHRQVEAVANVNAQASAGAGQGAEQTHLDLVGGQGWRGQ